MPDLQNFSITAQSAANVNVPRAVITATLIDSDTGAVLADFTGANSINFPGVMSTLTVAQRRKIAETLAHMLIYMRAGFDDGGT